MKKVNSMSEKEKKPGEGEPEITTPEGENPKEKTAGEIIEEAAGGGEGGEGEGSPDGDGEGEKEMVPLSSLMEFKKENKDLKKAIKKLEDAINAGDTSKDDIAKEIEDLADEYDVDPKFASKLVKILEARATEKVGEAMKPILEQNKKLTQKEKDDLIDKAFTKHFAAAMETMPEYEEIVDAETIKALSLLPKNAKKTFAQLIEETYGRAITGKRTIDDTKPGGGKEPELLDMEKARKDTEYFKEVMANPTLKAEYNKRMLLPRNRQH